MTDRESKEMAVLQREYEWLLSEELPRAYGELAHLLESVRLLFPLLDGHCTRSSKFVMTALANTTTDALRAVVTVTADQVTTADISFKPSGSDGKRHAASGGNSAAGDGGSPNSGFRTSVPPDAPWRLQQIQDAYNYLVAAQDTLGYSNTRRTGSGCTAELGLVLEALHDCRQSLLVPRKKTITELLASPGVAALSPPLPEGTALSFYVQAHKLVLAVYSVGPPSPSTPRVACSSQAECPLLWLAGVLAGVTTALQLAAGVKDKIGVFSQYQDIEVPQTAPVSG